MRQAQVLPLLAATSIVVLCVYFALRSKSSIERDDSSSNDESSLGEKKDMTSTIEEEHDRSPKIEEKINTPNESINGAMKKEEEASMINNDEIEEKVQLQNQNQIHKNDSQNDDSNKDEEEEKKSPNVKKNDIPVLIAYGSQSGNATCIAQDVYEKLSDKGINCNLSDLNSWKKWPTKLEDTKFAVFVISTTGNGDAPDNCDKFQRYIKKKDIPEKFLTNLSCCVLGLGDTNYDKFCEVAQWLQRRLVALDAKFLMKIALADDATGLEDVVEPWLEEVVPIIEDAVDGKLPTNMIKTKENVVEEDEEVVKEVIDTNSRNEIVEVEQKPISKVSSEKVSAASRQAVIDATDKVSGEFNFVNPLAAAGRKKQDTSKPMSNSLSAASLSSSPLHPLLQKRGLYSFVDCVGGEKTANEIVDVALNANKSRIHKVVGMGLYTVEFAKSKEVPISQCEKSDAKSDDEGTTFKLKVDNARYLTNGKETAERRVIHAQFSGGPNYRVGDAIGVRCENEDDDVTLVLAAITKTHQNTQEFSDDAIVKLKNARSGESVSLPPGCDHVSYNNENENASSSSLMRRDSVKGLLKYGVDLSAPPKPQLCAALAQFCPIGSKDRAILFALAMKEDKKNKPSSQTSVMPYDIFVSSQELRTSELIAFFPLCEPPLSALIALLPPLSTRYYSISSSPLSSSSSTTTTTSPTMSIAFSVVNTKTEHPTPIPRFGLCTNWLEKQFHSNQILSNNNSQNMIIEANLKPCSDFTLPSNSQAPVIMIGPGTGVAPFIGFIQHRQFLLNQSKQSENAAAEEEEPQEEKKETQGSMVTAALATAFAVKLKTKAEKTKRGKKKDKKNKSHKTNTTTQSPPQLEEKNISSKELVTEERVKKSAVEFGKMILYFGCRTHEDWLYREEMESAVADGTLTSLRTAFSRMQKEKVYVQDLLRQDAAHLLPLLLGSEACFYICGDGTKMAKDVHDALLSILKTEKNMTDEKAESLLSDMKDCGRYVQDIW